MLHRLYATSPGPTELPTYCNIGPYASCLFYYYLRVRLRQFLGRALQQGQASGPSAARLGQARGPGAAAATPYAAVIPRPSRSDV